MNNFFKLCVTVLFLSYSFVALPFDWAFEFDPSKYTQISGPEDQDPEISNKSLTNSMNKEQVDWQKKFQNLEAEFNATKNTQATQTREKNAIIPVIDYIVVLGFPAVIGAVIGFIIGRKTA